MSGIDPIALHCSPLAENHVAAAESNPDVFAPDGNAYQSPATGATTAAPSGGDGGTEAVNHAEPSAEAMAIGAPGTPPG